MISIEKIKVHSGELFLKAMELYESAFPEIERRDVPEQMRVMSKSDYRLSAIMDGVEFLGIIFYWETDDFIFIEHLAVSAERRGEGVGSYALEIMKGLGKKLILEIEPPVDEVTKRRLSFYERAGFKLTDHHHIQAKYRVGDEDLVLKILSYPEKISAREYEAFYEYMIKEVGVRVD